MGIIPRIAHLTGLGWVRRKSIWETALEIIKFCVHVTNITSSLRLTYSQGCYDSTWNLYQTINLDFPKTLPLCENKNTLYHIFFGMSLRKGPEQNHVRRNSVCLVLLALRFFFFLSSLYFSVKLYNIPVKQVTPLRLHLWWTNALKFEDFSKTQLAAGGAGIGTHAFRSWQPRLCQWSAFLRGSSRLWFSLPWEFAALENLFSFLFGHMRFHLWLPESLWEGDLKPVWSFSRNFSSTRQVLKGGCRLDFTSTSVLFIFASLQYYQLLLHMGDPYCALVKWYHIMLLCLYHQTLLMKKSPGLPRFICSIYFSQTLFWIKHLR